MHQPNLEFVRFKDVATDLLYDCKLMNDGVIVKQCYPQDWNIFFCSFDEFVDRFEPSYATPEDE
jgi:hypothetical protein